MRKDFIRGIYLHDGFIFEPTERCPFYWKYEDWERYIDWLESVGVNTIEFCTQAAFLRMPSTQLEFDRIDKMKRVIKYAHKKGMKVWYIVASNALSAVPDGSEPIDQREKSAFSEPCPRFPENREKIISTASYFIEQYKEADAFELFAGDWGGCNCGKCDYTTYIELALDYYKAIKAINPNAEVYLNTWAISYWQPYDKENPDWGKLFDDECKYAVKVADSLKGLPSDIGISMPFHHLYRPLAINGRSEADCPQWPDKQLIGELHKQGRKVIAWPHFIVENDPYHIGRWGFMNSRLSYLRSLTDMLKDLNIDGIMGNLYNPQLQPLMAFAFGKMTGETYIGDEEILKSFASLLVVKEDVEKLYSVLAYIENNDPWEVDLPESWKRHHVRCSIDRSEAVEIMKSLTVVNDNAGKLMLSPSDCLKIIDSTLELMSDKPLKGSLS